VDLFDTAAMYSGGASERRLGGLANGRHVVIATKFPPGWLSTAEALPDALGQSLARLRRSAIDLYQHHFPLASATASGPSVAAGLRHRCRMSNRSTRGPAPLPGSAARKGCAVAAQPAGKAATTSPSYLRAAEVADILHVSPKTVSRWAKEGKLPFLKTLGGHRRYPEAEIRQLAEGLREETTV
jgi:excisionase family DNA binding protein